ncbi:hypothetical protein ACLOJK_006936 [Asimina triloba]
MLDGRVPCDGAPERADLSPHQAAVGGRRAALDGDVEATMVMGSVVGCRWTYALARDGWTLDLLQLDVMALLMGGGLAGVAEEGGGAARLWI